MDLKAHPIPVGVVLRSLGSDAIEDTVPFSRGNAWALFPLSLGQERNLLSILSPEVSKPP